MSLLTPEQIEQVHEYALHILETVGVRVDSPSLREQMVREYGVHPTDGDVLRLPRQIVEWALKAAPATIELYDRQGNPAFRLGEDRPRFGVGATTLYYQDPLTDNLAPFGRKHMQAMVQLGHRLPNYDVISTIGVEQDVPVPLSDLYGTLDMVANTTKPLVILISEDQSFPAVLDLLEHLHDDLAAKPFVIPYFNPVTPPASRSRRGLRRCPAPASARRRRWGQRTLVA